jgi:hypothetical protein
MAFTLFPGLVGLFYVAGRVACGQAAGVGRLFLSVRRFYRRGLSLGLLVLVPLLMALNTYDLLLAYPGMTWLWLPLVLQLAAVVATALTCAHALSLLALYDLPLAQALLYAWAVLARAPLATVGTLGLSFLLGLAAWWTRGGLLPVALAVWTVFAVNLTYLIVRHTSVSFREEQSQGTRPIHEVRL